MHRLELGLPRQQQRQGSRDDAQSACAAPAPLGVGSSTNAGPDRATSEQLSELVVQLRDAAQHSSEEISRGAEQAMRQFQARGRTAIETLTEIAVATLQAETASKN